MSERKINLEEIITNLQNGVLIKSSQSLTIDFKIAMLEFGIQLLELADENARSNYITYDAGEPYLSNASKTILDTIKQVE